MASEQLLVNFFYAYPVGHAVEALHRCRGYHAADASLEISLVRNAESPVRLADFCPFIASAYGIEHPFVEPRRLNVALGGRPAPVGLDP